MYTRSQYLNGEVSHSEYFRQFVTSNVLAVVRNRIGEADIKASKDEHFNDIPLQRWDAIIGFNGARPMSSLGLSSLFNEAGEWATAAVLVCVMKQAAEMIRSEGK